jgi:hypothetical protein
MSSGKTPIRFRPSSTQFRQHSDSIAERLHTEIMNRIQAELRALSGQPPTDDGLDWLDLTPDSTPEEVDEAFRNTFERQEGRFTRTFALCERRLISECPLDVSWCLWDMLGAHTRFDELSPAQWEICADARRTVPTRHLGLMELEWEAAPDDARYVPMTPKESGDVEWRWGKGSPSHVHAEGMIESVLVHIDRVTTTKYGPGRSFLEFRIFASGELAGRGGRSGCSLGGGGSDLPAVGRIASNVAITVDDLLEDGRPIVELWEVFGAKRGRETNPGATRPRP